MTTTTGVPAVAGRYPVRVPIDGDFTPDQILAALNHAGTARAVAALPMPGVAEAAAHARLWRLADLDDAAAVAVTSPDSRGPDGGPSCRAGVGTAGVPSRVDVALLHSFETCPVLRPPVAERTALMTVAAGRAWLSLAAHWIGVAARSGDLRFLNAACKLLGGVWASPGSRAGTEPELAGQLTAVALLVRDASDQLTARLAARLPILDSASGPSGAARPVPGHAAGAGCRIVLLAGAGSGSPARLAAMAADAGITLSAVVWYGSPPAVAAPSGYADAWYPPQPATAQQDPAPDLAGEIAQTTAFTWEQTAAALRRFGADLVILLGMPIVPPIVLAAARIAVINAHNGSLPTYRGMDAVAWALLNNDPIICTAHLVAPGVDSGPVLTTTAVPARPAATLRARVKDAQLRMLTATAGYVTATGALPDVTVQPAGLGRQFYRLHPHLKRVLDASPYAADAQPPQEETR